jgi:hypothetical protein
VEVEDCLMHRILGLVNVRDEVPDAAVVLVRDLPAPLALVDEPDLQPLVQERLLPKAATECVERELQRLGEYLRISSETDCGTGPLGLL